MKIFMLTHGDVKINPTKAIKEALKAAKVRGIVVLPKIEIINGNEKVG